MTNDDDLKKTLAEIDKRLDALEKRLDLLMRIDEVNVARFYFLHIKTRLEEIETRLERLEKMAL